MVIMLMVQKEKLHNKNKCDFMFCASAFLFYHTFCFCLESQVSMSH